MPEIITLDGLAADRTYKARPGTRYQIATDADGRATAYAVLKSPTDALVRQFDQIVKDATKRARRLQALTRRRMAAEKRAANLAVDGGSEGLAEVEAELEALEVEIEAFDPTNPDGEAYYVLDWLRKLDVACDLFHADGKDLGSEVLIGDIDGLQTGVAKRAVEDWQGLAFLSSGSG